MNAAAIVFAALVAGGGCVYAGFVLGVTTATRKREPVQTLTMQDTVTVSVFEEDREFYVASCSATVTPGTSSGRLTLELAPVPPKRTERSPKGPEFA